MYHCASSAELGAREAPQVGVEALDAERPLAGGEVGQRGVVQPLRRHARRQRDRRRGWRRSGRIGRRPRRGRRRADGSTGVAGAVGNCGIASRSASTSCDRLRDAHVVLVDALADHAQVAAELIDGQLLIGERLAGRRGLLVDARVDRLQRRASAARWPTVSCCWSCWVCSCSMRMSAIICISRRDCAAAGLAASTSEQPPSPRTHDASPCRCSSAHTTHLTLR